MRHTAHLGLQYNITELLYGQKHLEQFDIKLIRQKHFVVIQ